MKIQGKNIMARRIILIFIFTVQGCAPSGSTIIDDQTSSVRKVDVNREISSTVSDLSKLYLDGMVTLMLTEKMEKKKAFREIFLSRPDILDIRIIRISKNYEFINRGHNQDGIDQNQYLNNIVSFSNLNEKSRILSVELPFLATENTRGVNCIVCHNVQTGKVLGILRVEYSLLTAETQNKNEFKNKIYNFLCMNALPSDECKLLRKINKKRCPNEREACI